MKIFVGYGGTRAEKYAQRLARRLRKSGFKAFIATPHSKNMIAGLNFTTRVFRALADADVVVMVCTKATLNSRAANAEIKMAQDIETPVIPFIELGSPVPRKLTQANAWLIRFDGKNPNKEFPTVILTLQQLEPIVRNMKAIRRQVYQ